METHNGLWTGVFIVSATNINYTPTAPSTTPPHMHTPPHFSPCLNELQNASDSLSFMILLKWHCCSFKELHTEAGISLCFHFYFKRKSESRWTNCWSCHSVCTSMTCLNFPIPHRSMPITAAGGTQTSAHFLKLQHQCSHGKQSLPCCGNCLNLSELFKIILLALFKRNSAYGKVS